MSEAVKKDLPLRKKCHIHTVFGGKRQEERNINSKPDKFGLHLDRSIDRVHRHIYSYITDLSFLSL